MVSSMPPMNRYTNYAKETLKREEDAKRIADKILEEKVILLLKGSGET